mmetsp:Transcript_71372/g.225414  ORF Transcript_71372/g.225414 Transcript_71372/m.225414 type:complete len:202 (+) Transcript_71372:374-979(+)
MPSGPTTLWRCPWTGTGAPRGASASSHPSASTGTWPSHSTAPRGAPTTPAGGWRSTTAGRAGRASCILRQGTCASGGTTRRAPWRRAWTACWTSTSRSALRCPTRRRTSTSPAGPCDTGSCAAPTRRARCGRRTEGMRSPRFWNGSTAGRTPTGAALPSPRSCCGRWTSGWEICRARTPCWRSWTATCRAGNASRATGGTC